MTPQKPINSAKSKSLKIMQWNAKSIISNGAELEKYLEDQKPKPHIICIQETWLTAEKNVHLQGYECHRQDRGNGAGGGVAIFIQSWLPARRIPVTFSPIIEGIAVEVLVDEKRLAVCNIYHADRRTDSRIFSDVLHQLPLTTILCGDFNSHNTLWGGRKIDYKGRILEDFIEDAGLVLLNDGSGTHVSPISGLSPIDLAFASPQIAAKCTWSVDSTTTIGSDHLPIFIQVKKSLNPTPDSPQRRWNFKKADWEKFSRICTEEISESLVSDDVEMFNLQISKAIIKCAEESIPTSSPHPSKPGVPWWTEECKKATDKKKKALNRVRHSALPEDFRRYQLARSDCSATIKKAKVEHWKDYCSKLTKSANTKELWDRIKLMTRDNKVSRPSLLINKSGNFLTDDKEKADLLAEHYEGVSSDVNLSKEFLEFRDKFEREEADIIADSSEDQSAINKDFSEKELEEVLEAAKHSAPGRDRITTSMLRHLPKSARLILLKLINSSWRSWSLPAEWKHSTIVPVLKPIKAPTEPASYRPLP